MCYHIHMVLYWIAQLMHQVMEIMLLIDLSQQKKGCLKREMLLMGKWSSNNTTNIGTLPSASKDLSIKFVDQCLHIFNNKERLNGLKGITKTKKRQSQLKYQSRI